MSPFACKYCIAERGLRGSEIASLPKNDEEFARHVESEHHIPVRRAHETKQQAMERFQRENPEAGGPNCKCPQCSAARRIVEMLAPAEPAPALDDDLAAEP